MVEHVDSTDWIKSKKEAINSISIKDNKRFDTL